MFKLVKLIHSWRRIYHRWAVNTLQKNGLFACSFFELWQRDGYTSSYFHFT